MVCVQGLGFVGAAMAIATAYARDDKSRLHYNVIGVDLPSLPGIEKVNALNSGRMPIVCNDAKFNAAFESVHKTGNLLCTTAPEAFAAASVVVVDVHLDVTDKNDNPVLALDGFRNAIRTVGQHIRPGCLVIVETTVPPGTCEHIVAPELRRAFAGRGLPQNGFLLAHAYERVMPGEHYFDSIVNFWRVFAGFDEPSAAACETFLAKVVNTRDYPLRRLHSTTASETAKVLENSYRAANIAFISEWSRFAEAVGVDLQEVVEAIRVRPTHSNIRQPGFGVGGYCLTKDPLFAMLSAKELFGRPDLEFPFCRQTVLINHAMPLDTLERVQQLLDGQLRGKRLLLLGVSYRPDVSDTRYSPSEIFVHRARAQGAIVHLHDPLVDFWPELNENVPRELPDAKNADALVIAVPHREYRQLDFAAWLAGSRTAIVDASDVLSKPARETLRRAGCKVESMGRGSGL